MISKKDIKKSAILRAIANEVFGFKKKMCIRDRSDEALEQAVEQVFDLRPTAIIRDLDLRRPIYRQLAAYGHMGREDLGVTWERADRVDQLKAALNVK